MSNRACSAAMNAMTVCRPFAALADAVARLMRHSAPGRRQNVGERAFGLSFCLFRAGEYGRIRIPAARAAGIRESRALRVTQ